MDIISRNIFDKIKWRMRFLNAAFRVTPDFLIIGAQKCGTTSLWDYLLRHPNILENYDNRKEIQYFDQNLLLQMHDRERSLNLLRFEYTL